MKCNAMFKLMLFVSNHLLCNMEVEQKTNDKRAGIDFCGSFYWKTVTGRLRSISEG